jgi:ribosome-interacting GTPase 1
MRTAFPDLEVVPVSIIDDASLDAFRTAAWRLTGLIRVYLRRGEDVDEEPLALAGSSTVLDVARQIHKDLAADFRGAKVWGPSARFDGQRVGRDHVVLDGDIVEILR